MNRCSISDENVLLRYNLTGKLCYGRAGAGISYSKRLNALNHGKLKLLYMDGRLCFKVLDAPRGLHVVFEHYDVVVLVLLRYPPVLNCAAHGKFFDVLHVVPNRAERVVATYKVLPVVESQAECFNFASVDMCFLHCFM